MRIAYTIAQGQGGTDLLLFNVATQLRELGYRTAGTVQINTEREDAGPCDMDVQVLPEGDRIRISQSLGAGSKGCRLDPFALESAVGQVDARLAAGADILIINKFGKHEAQGRGFRDTIATAVSLGIPVLVGTNNLNKDALLEFTGGTAEWLPAQENEILNWFEMRPGQEELVA